MGTSELVKLADDLGLMGALVMFVVMVLVSALLLCLIFRIVVGYMPSYPHSISVILLSVVAAAAVSIVAGMVLPRGPGQWIGWGAALLVGAAWVDYQLLAQDGRRIGYQKAFLVQLAFLAICLLTWMAFTAGTVVITAS